MKKLIVLLVLIFSLSGCSYIPWFSKKPAKEAEKRIITNTVVLSKADAVQRAKEFMNQQGFDDDFIVSKPHKISKQLTMERNSRWVWRVHFPSRNRSFWKFWKRSPLMVEVDASSGQVAHWGRR